MKILILNWKMNPNTLEGAKSLFSDTIGIAKSRSDVLTVVCPSFVHLVDCAHLLEAKNDAISVSLGSQNVAHQPEGALTGAVSVQILKDTRVDYALIGHSELRYKVGELSSNIKDKILNCLAFGIVPVVFIGERKKGDAWQDEIIDQFNEAVTGLTSEQVAKIIFVYEPVWAISDKNKLADFDVNHTKDAGMFIRNIIAKLTGIVDSNDCLVLYGGSVSPSMINELDKLDEFNGAVVGGVSLKLDDLQDLYQKIGKNSKS